jgi:hypothetical protein
MSPDEWAFKISELIKEAEADGFMVCIDNECCGCSGMNLMVGRFDREEFKFEGVNVDW